MHGDVAMEEKTVVKKDDSKEINLRGPGGGTTQEGELCLAHGEGEVEC